MDAGVVIWYVYPRKGKRPECHATIYRRALCTDMAVPPSAKPHVVPVGKDNGQGGRYGVYPGLSVCRDCRNKLYELWTAPGHLEIESVGNNTPKDHPSEVAKPQAE